jgi:molybdate transport system permease protein
LSASPSAPAHRTPLDPGPQHHCARLSIPLAWWIASGTGLRRALIRAIVALPLVLPSHSPRLLSPRRARPAHRPRPPAHAPPRPSLAFSFTGLLIGSLLYSLPFAVQPLVAGFSAIDRSYLEAAAGLGASPSRTFRTHRPSAQQSSLLTAAVLTFTHTVGEFGVVLMLGGNIPGATRTLSIALYDQVQDFNYAAANRTAASCSC